MERKGLEGARLSEKRGEKGIGRADGGTRRGVVVLMTQAHDLGNQHTPREANES